MKKIILLALLLTGLAAFSQQKDTQTTLQITNQQLEQEILKLNTEIESLQKKVKEGNEQLNQAEKLYAIAEEVYEKTKDSISMSDRLIYGALYGTLGMLISILGLFGFSFYKVRKTSKEALVEAQAVAEQKVAEITLKNEAIIHDMISKHGKEKLLLETSNILIINKENTNTDIWFSMILKRFNNLPTIKNIPDIETFNTDNVLDFDAVILDNIDYEGPNENWNFTLDHSLKSKLVDIANRTCENGSAFLYFGDTKKDGRFAESLPRYNHLINFANKPATLFANLIDLLDFRRLINEKS